MFGEYIKARRKNIMAWVIVCGLFALVFSLYRLPIAPVVYGALLSGFFGLILRSLIIFPTVADASFSKDLQRRSH